MRLKWIFVLIMMVLAASVATTFLIPSDGDPTLIWVTRTGCGLALLLMVVFYVKVMKPLGSITNGFDLLRAQDFSSRLTHVHQQEADRIIDMFNKMMQSLKNERLHLREQNHFLDLLINVSPMGILILDTKDTVVSANPSASTYLEFTGGSKIEGTPLNSLDTQLGRTLRSLAQGETMTVRLNDSMIYRCSRLSFMNQGFAHPFILIEKLTDEVMKAEKKSYEKVIRVIAHEVNNTMAGVRAMLTTAGAVLEENPDENADLLEVISVCENRCDAMSSFITSYANVVKIPEANLMATDLNAEISHWRIMLESLCTGRNIKVNFELSDRPVNVRIDPVLMEQVLINIVKNSAESIGYDGCITVTTAPHPPTLTITDNGRGISEETEKMLFSPFFSTKVNGHGIGLIFVSEVLHKHGCKFSLRTSSDNLTRFTIRFPIAN